MHIQNNSVGLLHYLYNMAVDLLIIPRP